MPPERLAAMLARLVVYVVFALGGATLLHAREPANPTGSAFVVLLGGIAAVGAARAFARRARRARPFDRTKGRSPPA